MSGSRANESGGEHRLHRGLLPLLAFLALLLLPPVTASAQTERRALLMPGKTTLYQRVITKPGASLLAAPEASATVVAADLPPFSIYYVFSETPEFVEVGVATRGAAKGFVAKAHVEAWKHSMVAYFNNRVTAGRERVLFFADRDALAAAVGADGYVDLLAELREDAARGAVDPSSGVVAIEPETSVDDATFYLLPILDHDAVRFADGKRGRALEVASINTEDPEPAPPPDDFRAGIVFVVDTTLSMQPYIDATRDIIARINGDFAGSAVAANVRFGLVGFRQSVADEAALEYHVQPFLPLGEAGTGDALLAQLKQMKAAEVPTASFAEDAIGGLFAAVEAMDWGPFGARYVVLVTDASPHRPEIGRSFAGAMDVAELARLAQAKGIQIATLHLRTPSGKRDHDAAEQAYRQFSAGNGLYFPVEGGSAEAFGRAVEPLTRQAIADVSAIRANRTPEPVDDSDAARRMALVGRAFQLDYLGRRQGTAAPPFYRAWTGQKALEKPIRDALEIRVLITRNQLSSLAAALRDIVAEADRTAFGADPMETFRRFQELAARANNDMRQVGDTTPLGDLLGEYLAGLPYTSAVAGLVADDWRDYNDVRRDDVMRQMRSKLAYYERIAGGDGWTKLDPDAPDGEDVVAMPLSLLP